MRELTVDLGERSYPIYIGEGLLDQASTFFDNHQISKQSPLLIVSDEHVASYYLDSLCIQLQQAGYKTAKAVVAAGEKSKSLMVLEDIVSIALNEGLDRNSTIVALGGGVVGDLAGFVAASFMRGVRFIQIPTTILAHDSSVGGKVAVNHPSAKNIIGAFHQPEMVIYDISTLTTLPKREIVGGLSEVIKHGLIWDRSFVEWVDNHSEKLLSLDSEALQYALYQGCLIKSIVVSEDEREQGLRAILNLGHTMGHAFEAVAEYNELIHGEAISIGMVGAAKLSVKLGYPESIYLETKRILKKLGLPVKLPEHMNVDAIFKAMMHDKKFKGQKMMFVIATEIGKVEMNHNITVEWVMETLEELKREE